jgi:rhodanese-related sulfurtransferase
MAGHRQLAALAAAWIVVWAGNSAAQAPEFSPAALQSAPRMTLEEFRRLHAADRVLVIDVRDAPSFKTGHIPGAMNVPLDQIDARAGDLEKRAKGRRIVTYCACANEHASAQAALRLIQNGVVDVSALVGGLRAWMAAGGRIQS